MISHEERMSSDADTKEADGSLVLKKKKKNTEENLHMSPCYSCGVIQVSVKLGLSGNDDVNTVFLSQTVHCRLPARGLL